MSRPRSQEVIEQEHRKTAALPVEADEDRVTFRNLPKMCNAVASSCEDREEARQELAVIMLRRQMGQPIGGALKYARMEYRRNLGRRHAKKLVFECEGLDDQPVCRDYDTRKQDLIDFRQWYMKARCYLPERERRVCDQFIEGKSGKEIASNMGITYSTAAATKNHAIGRLRKLSTKRHLLREAVGPRQSAEHTP